ncbi:MAG: YdeI/OmpD-associated family protein [Christensenellaceae bacterium]
MKTKSRVLAFCDRTAFREWLEENGADSEGIWLLFGKKSGPATLSAGEALEEALCFGWIDGQMQSIDSTKYKKYFARRTTKSKWSEKNKALTERLEAQGVMTDRGREKIEEAKKDGRWSAPKPPDITDEKIQFLSDLLKEYEPAHTNFLAMPPSVQKTYTRAYFDAKTDVGREKRIFWMVERLNKNLRPM